MSGECQESVVSSIFAILRASGHCENSSQFTVKLFYCTSAVCNRLFILPRFLHGVSMSEKVICFKFKCGSTFSSQVHLDTYDFWISRYLSHTSDQLKLCSFFRLFRRVCSLVCSAHEVSPNYTFGMSACKYYFRTNRSYLLPPPPDTHTYSRVSMQI